MVHVHSARSQKSGEDGRKVKIIKSLLCYTKGFIIYPVDATEP